MKVGDEVILKGGWHVILISRPQPPRGHREIRLKHDSGVVIRTKAKWIEELPSPPSPRHRVTLRDPEGH